MHSEVDLFHRIQLLLQWLCPCDKTICRVVMLLQSKYQLLCICQYSFNRDRHGQMNRSAVTYNSHTKLKKFCWIWKTGTYPVPLKKIRKVKGNKVKPIWMTNKALKYVGRKGKVYKKYKNNDHPAVKAANRSVTKEIKKAKRNFEKKLAQNGTQNLFLLMPVVNLNAELKREY